MAIYRVIIRQNNGDKIYARFRDRVPAEVFTRLCISTLTDIKEFRDCHRIRVDGAWTPKGPGNTPRPADGSIWCPYCKAYRYFERWYSIAQCEVCGITANEYYVRRVNDQTRTPGVDEGARLRRRQRRQRRRGMR